eukprot:g44695.t1
MLLLQFACGIIVTLEEAQDGHVIEGMGEGIKMVGNWKVLLILVYTAQTLCESVIESVLGLTDVDEAASGATDTADLVGGYTSESLSDLERLFGALDGGDRASVVAGAAPPTVAGKGTGGGQVGGECEADEGVA